METSQLISAAIRAIKKGDFEVAAELLKRTVKQDPSSEAGWVLLGYSLEDPQQKIYCYRKALQINPENETAQRFLRSLSGGVQSPPPPDKTASATSNQVPSAVKPQRSSQIVQHVNKRNRLVFWTTFFLGLIAIGIPLWMRISGSKLPPDFIFKPARALVSLTGGATAPEEMWFPEWATITPTSEMDSPLTLPTPTPGFSDDASFLDRFNSVQSFISQAQALFGAGNYAEAISLWDQILGVVPEYATGYYARAANYWVMGTKDQRALSQAQQYYDLALADLEQARLLGPDQAVYSYLEYEISRSEASLEEDRTLRSFWLDKALNALATGISKGHRVSIGNHIVAELLVTLERCDEALAYTRELEKAIGIPDEDSASIYLFISQSHLCLKEYDEALEYIDRAIELAPSEFSELLKGIILMNKGELDASLEIFDTMIEERPHFYGGRYIFRGVIHYELGNIDQAILDLETGLANSPESKGPVSYLQALLAIDEGDEELALEYLQEAEATLFSYSLPRFYDDSVRLISELGGISVVAAPEIEPSPTPISPISDVEYYLPTPGTDQFTFEPANYGGTGFYLHSLGRGVGRRFYPDEAIQISGTISVTLRLDTDHDPDTLALRAACVPKDGNWSLDNYPEGTVELVLGENSLLDPDECIFDTGLIYIVIWNEGEEDILVNNLELKIVAIAPDGSEETYGYQ